MRNSPILNTPLGSGVFKVRPCEPKIISIAARSTMDRAMVNMITTQRAYEMNSKVITTADEMLRKASTLK